ncbi:MAG: hypothetical protein RBR71_12860 [Gudongella sp.]|nr:hypothetical protein [Gudongella sp.]
MYDFKMLSDYDFELLTQDLLQKALNCRLESFKKGKDKGIDLRYSNYRRKDTIIQCKHYANSTFSSLKSNLKNKEYSKIKALNPSRYILVTSQGLTPYQKDELFQILDPYCLSTSDIFGMNELNSLLRQFVEVEKNHYKLWLTSTSLLEKITHSSVYNRSEINMDRTLTRFKIYVQNKAYYKALDILKDSHCCIISGIPGIGKTTLAEMLLISYLDMGYEVIKISQNINEAFKVYSSKSKQIFLYDDFLGQTGLDLKLYKNEDNDILTFIRYIEKDGNSKFILTTREYILNQAKSTYESLERSNIDLKKTTLVLDDYTKHDKAKILFNHLYYNRLPKSYIKNLLNNDISKIINHKNYNPRIIEILTENLLPPESYKFYDTFINNLNNPSKIWEFAFKNHISQESRNLLILLISLPFRVDIKILKKIYDFYNKEKSTLYNREFSDRDFKYALKELDGSFIYIDKENVSFKDPSVKDYIEQYIIQNDIEFEILCDTAICFEQCLTLYNFSGKNKYSLLKKNSESFADAILMNLLSFDIKLVKDYLGPYPSFNYESVIQRIITVMKINMTLKHKGIDDYLMNDFFENLSTNFIFYGSKTRDYIELLKLSLEKDYKEYFDQYIIKEIVGFCISEISDYYIEEIEDFEIVEIVSSYYPELIDESIMEELADVFSNFYEDDYNSVVDWGGVEYVEDYARKLEELGGLFSVNIDEALKYLEQEAEKIENSDEGQLIEKYRDKFRDEVFNDEMILDMFDVLLNISDVD